MTDQGMVPPEDWEQTDIHKASAYSCGKCGARFESPQAVYDHLDIAHPHKTEMRVRGKTRYVPGQAKSSRRKTW